MTIACTWFDASAPMAEVVSDVVSGDWFMVAYRLRCASRAVGSVTGLFPSNGNRLRGCY